MCLCFKRSTREGCSLGQASCVLSSTQELLGGFFGVFFAFLSLPNFPVLGEIGAGRSPCCVFPTDCCGSQPWTQHHWWKFSLDNKYVLINEW